PMPDHLDLDDHLPDGYTLRDGVALCTDQWDGYRAERRRLVDLLDRRGGGTVVLSADIHSSWVFDGPFTDDLRPVAGELTGTSISSTTMGANLGRAGSVLAERVADTMEHVRWADLDQYGFVLVDVTPEAVEGSFWAVDPHDRSATARRMAAWSIAPTEGARWVRVDGGEEASGSSVAGKLVRVGVVVGAGLVLRPLLRSARRGVAAARSRRG
ncbi:MAG TPA: alkaline phosphatase D family protein, partial [Iamia sp.]